ncbi:hypothetical protein F5Y17DRAFT_206839 [Xylariaceae sp. FL0594]|nr:hypothetical protein F5Y17DRAFT_206839 [Xylariaceae sp. FL0594]
MGYAIKKTFNWLDCSTKLFCELQKVGKIMIRQLRNDFLCKLYPYITLQIADPTSRGPSRGNQTMTRPEAWPAAHHLVVDLQSWFVVVNDLESVLTNNTPTSGPSVTYRKYIQDQQLHVLGPAEDLPFQLPQEDREYWGLDCTGNVYRKVNTCTCEIGAEIMSTLETIAQSSGTDLFDIFIAALLLSFARTFPDRRVPTLWNQQHRRTSFNVQHNISETVGWFTSLVPFSVSVEPKDNILSVISRIRDIRREIERGVRFFATSLRGPDEAEHIISSYLPLEMLSTFVGPSQRVRSRSGLLEQLGKKLLNGSPSSSSATNLKSHSSRRFCRQPGRCCQSGERRQPTQFSGTQACQLLRQR